MYPYDKRKNNIYDLSKDYGIGYTEDHKHCFLFDLEDYELLTQYYWGYRKDGYFEAVIPQKKESKKKQRVLMHRFVLNVLDSAIYIDHINHVVSDNRKENLRIVNSQINQQNRKRNKINTSGVTGVSYDKRDKRWDAYINWNYKKISLGSFTDFNDAVKARKDAEEKYFGEFSYDNSQKIAKNNLIQGDNSWVL